MLVLSIGVYTMRTLISPEREFRRSKLKSGVELLYLIWIVLSKGVPRVAMTCTLISPERNFRRSELG